MLLLTTSTASFRQLIPLLLFSTVTLAAGPWISAWSNRRAGAAGDGAPRFSARVFPLLLVISIYNGYFGAGGGILLLAGLTVAGVGDTRQLNTLKILIQITANATAVVVFLGSAIDWQIAMAMSLAAAFGGFAGMAGSPHSRHLCPGDHHPHRRDPHRSLFHPRWIVTPVPRVSNPCPVSRVSNPSLHQMK